MDDTTILAKVAEKILEAYNNNSRIYLYGSIRIPGNVAHYNELLGEGILERCALEAYEINKDQLVSAFPSELKRVVKSGNVLIDEQKNLIQYKEADRNDSIQLSENGDILWTTNVTVNCVDDKFISDYIYANYNKPSQYRQFIIPGENPGCIARNDTRPVISSKLKSLIEVFGDYAFTGPFTLYELSKLIDFDCPPFKSDIFMQLIAGNEVNLAYAFENIYTETGMTLGDYTDRLKFIYRCFSRLDEDVRNSVSLADMYCLLDDEQQFFDYVSILDGTERNSRAGTNGIMEDMFVRCLKNGKNSPISELDISLFILKRRKMYGIPENCEDPVAFIAKKNKKERELDWVREYGKIPDNNFLRRNVPKVRMKDFADDSFYDKWVSLDAEVQEMWFRGRQCCEGCAEKDRYGFLMMYLISGYENSIRILNHIRRKVYAPEFDEYISKPGYKGTNFVRNCYHKDDNGDYVMLPRLTDTQKQKLRILSAQHGYPLIMTPAKAIDMFAGLDPRYSPTFAQYIKNNIDDILSEYYDGYMLKQKQEQFFANESKHRHFVKKSLGPFIGWHKQENLYCLDMNEKEYPEHSSEPTIGL